MADTNTASRYAFVKANWHAAIEQRALDGFLQIIFGEHCLQQGREAAEAALMIGKTQALLGMDA